MSETNGSQVLDIEVFSQSPVRSGSLRCPSSMRFIDLLNSQFSGAEESFLEMTAALDGRTVKVFLHQSKLEIIALTEGETRRGIGASSNAKAYPFVSKTARRVSIEMPGYSISGELHLPEGQDVASLLREPKAFFPLTSAVIAGESGLRIERPFVAVNKHQMVSLREES